MKYRIIVVMVLSFILVLATQLAFAQENYCKDPETWKDWDALLNNHPRDLEIQALHALRVGLCLKVERGDLTVDEAT